MNAPTCTRIRFLAFVLLFHFLVICITLTLQFGFPSKLQLTDEQDVQLMLSIDSRENFPTEDGSTGKEETNVAIESPSEDMASPEKLICENLNLSQLVLPIVLYGFNNQVDSLRHAILFGNVLGKQVIQPDFYPHYSCKETTKGEYEFPEVLQWTDEFLQDHKPVAFSALKKWIECNGIKRLEVDVITASEHADIEGYYNRTGLTLGIEFVVKNELRIKPNILGRLSSKDGLYEFASKLPKSERLTVVSIFGTIQSLATGKNANEEVQIALNSVLPAEHVLIKAEAVLTEAGFKGGFTFIHFRPFADRCTRMYKIGAPAKDCKNLDELDSLISRNKDSDVDIYVAYPPFLSKEGVQYLNETLNPLMTTTALEANEDIRQNWTCFEVSLLEQAMAVVSPRFDGCPHSSWTNSVEIFRHILNKE
jgi:hypothetical protein